MGMFEDVVVLTSIIIGLALAHLAKGLASLIQHPGRARIWWVHLVWVGYMFLNTLFWWWWEFRYHNIKTWTVQLYLFVLGYAFLLYLICALLFPKDLEGYEGFKDYLLSRRFWFFGLQILYAVVDLFDSWFKGADYFASLGREYLIAQVIYIGLPVIGMVTRNERVQGVIAVVFLAYQISWTLRIYETVS
jgi:hypothetical protein